MIQKRPLNELAEYREKHGLSREDLASEIGVTSVTIWRWETGARRPRPEYAGHVSQLTGVPIAELLGAQ